jgi:hypothetical protein
VDVVTPGTPDPRNRLVGTCPRCGCVFEAWRHEVKWDARRGWHCLCVQRGCGNPLVILKPKDPPT